MDARWSGCGVIWFDELVAQTLVQLKVYVKSPPTASSSSTKNDGITLTLQSRLQACHLLCILFNQGDEHQLLFFYCFQKTTPTLNPSLRPQKVWTQYDPILFLKQSLCRGSGKMGVTETLWQQHREPIYFLILHIWSYLSIWRLLQRESKKSKSASVDHAGQPV